MPGSTHHRAAIDWFDRVPKVELHLHLEGAIPLPTMWDLVRKHGGDRAIPDIAALRRRFTYRNFRSFIATWAWKNRFINDHADFTLIAAAVAHDLERQQVRYAEVFFSPPDFVDHGLTVPGIARAIRAGLAQVPTVEVRLICDLVRNFGPARALRTLDELEDARDQGIVGVGLGGSEPDHPAGAFREVFRRARDRGWRVTIHAGETAGPQSVRDALDCGADRIGHGVRAIEDDALVEELARRRIPLEVCPSSNLRIGVYPDLDRHPITRLRDRGCLVTVNSDDPLMFQCSLTGDLRLLSRRHHWSHDDVRTAMRNAVAASWLDQAGKDRLLERMQADPAWME